MKILHINTSNILGHYLRLFTHQDPGVYFFIQQQMNVGKRINSQIVIRTDQSVLHCHFPKDSGNEIIVILILPCLYIPGKQDLKNGAHKVAVKPNEINQTFAHRLKYRYFFCKRPLD